MELDLSRACEILERTPPTLQTLLQGLSPEWTRVTEGGQTWSVYDVVGHLIHGEKTDWLPRLEIMLSEQADKTFVPFDRLAQFQGSPCRHCWTSSAPCARAA
ncbi:hypothetical protein [Hymenobacter volaticus]|uniref:hypothetical protein n=1 Tax=Hymenobacter volaticus TaxID=2932254 RepID=UPI0028801B66|nr:hypothetical protein [Hymenobacter volaticus]